MQDIGALDANNTSLDTEWREQDIRAIVLNDLAHFVKALKQNGIKLGVSYHHWLHKHLGGHDKIMQSLLRTQDTLRVFTCDVYQIVWSSLCARGCVSKQSRERRREVDGGSCSRLDDLDVLASAAADQGVHGKLELHRVNVSFEL